MKISPASNPAGGQVGGFPCPRCSRSIQFPLQALLAQGTIACPHCGLELHIDPQRSAAALQELRRYTAGMAGARRKLDE